ncbi:MAG: RNA-binding protein [Paenibacillus sp.]|jgi:predicted RNA-binding protein (virulence factor B family)|nr:RNA-binding protein [Paenibacillus sp.]
MTLEAGTTRKLEVAREVSPNGFFLSDGHNEVLLHYSEVVGECALGDQVEVFLFHDSQDRLSATMKEPLIRLGELALLEVADVHPRFGCFLEMGLGRQLLLPSGELPEWTETRPRKGDRVFVTLAHDKQGRLTAKLAGERELSEHAFAAPTTWRNEWVDARVYKTLQNGTFVLCDGGVLGFGAIGMIHESERTRTLRLGEQVNCRVTFVREDGRVNLSMRAAKHVGQIEDADRILAYLTERPNGSMPYSDETPADIISEKFGISKGAFKRALGKLMKEGRVEQQGSWTKLKPVEKSEIATEEAE